MTSSYRHIVLHPFAVLLLLVAMVFVTAADAAACGAEVAPGTSVAWNATDADHTASEPDQEQDDTGSPAEQHGVCGHGHCHHGANFAGGIQERQLSYPPAILAPPAPVVLASAVSYQLKRPPRV